MLKNNWRLLLSSDDAPIIYESSNGENLSVLKFRYWNLTNDDTSIKIYIFSKILQTKCITFDVLANGSGSQTSFIKLAKGYVTIACYSHTSDIWISDVEVF